MLAKDSSLTNNMRNCEMLGYLKPLFVTAYSAGVRLGELLAIKWQQVDWEQGFITLNAAEDPASRR